MHIDKIDGELFITRSEVLLGEGYDKKQGRCTWSFVEGVLECFLVK